ncbi:hypothetical protein P12x_002400 [Tundrisphaera lichenicola]|uniref:hypothetical protein n=1 Tax=Tundrisphaera lichenicola TaxID=2029860 RepID=UPI003EC14118
MGAIILVCSTEWLISGHLANFTSNSASSWSWSSEASSKFLARADILCFGDSLVKFGLVPTVLERRLGLRASNLAQFQGLPATNFFLLRRALAAGARPRALIVDCELLERDPCGLELDRLWPELATLAEGAELAWHADDLSFFSKFGLSLILRSVRARQEIRTQVLLALRGQAAPLRTDYDRDRTNWESNRGAYLVPSEPHAPEFFDLGALKPAKWAAHRINLIFLDKFLGLAASRGIPVFLLLPPTHPDYQVANEKNGHEEAFVKFVRSLLADHPSLSVIDGRHAAYEHSNFIDLVHLNGRGAKAYTSALSDVIKARLSEPKRRVELWVELPRVREPSTRFR